MDIVDGGWYFYKRRNIHSLLMDAKCQLHENELHRISEQKCLEFYKAFQKDV
jgi:hypothetical protein